MRIIAEGLTDIGQHRQSNEDCFSIDKDQSLYIVADGVGGQPAGEVASRLVADRLPGTLSAKGDIGSFNSGELLSQSIREVNAELIDTAEQRAEWRGMSTTVVAAWWQLGELTLANVGDSRAYLLRNQEMTQISEDHTVLAEQQRLGVAENEQLVSMSHVITRCLGIERDIEVTIRSMPMIEGDRILLCSDGLTDSLSEEVIRSIILSARTPGEGCRMLIELANRNGGRDNITAVLIYFERARLIDTCLNLFRRRN